VFSFDAEVQAWTEFYNSRPGSKDITVLGSRIDGSTIFPSTTDSRFVFNGGKPSVDWLTLTAGGGIKLPGPFNDAFGKILYRTQKGEMSLLKGGTIEDPLVIPPTVPGSGPGTVFFDFPGRKDVDYKSLGGAVGTRSTLGGIAWRFDASAFRHEVKSDTREANFGFDAAGSELESFREDTDILTAQTNLVGSRQLTPDLFVYGGGVFSWARSEPEPSQIVEDGFLSVAPVRTTTRATLSSEVDRFAENLNAGLVYRPVNTVVVTADATFRASQQHGSLYETRNESGFPTGDTGFVSNSSDRDRISFLGRGNLSWKAARRLSFKGHVSYKYSRDSIESRRIFGFVVAEPDEIEDYDVDHEIIKTGVSGRYRFRGGRKLEIGYDFMYDGANTDVDEISNQFIVADYERLQHKIWAKASGRIMKKLRGEFRAQYIFEKRDMDAPIVQPIIVGPAGKGEMEFQGFLIMPMLTYQHSSTLSGYFSLSIGRQKYDLQNTGVTPPGFDSQFASFEYEALTETATLGINWSPLERLSGSASYTIYNNSKSVDNTGHNASIRGAYELNEDWDFTGGLRYLGYAPSNNTIDDYHTVIVTVGLAGRF